MPKEKGKERLKDKVAIITGASMGLGEAMALLFAREGARVTVADIADAKGQETVDQIKAEGEMLCIKIVHVGTEPLCCDKPADAPSPRTTSPESNPAPCGHSDDCSCCIKICCTVVLAPIERSDHSLIKLVVEIAPMADQTPADSRWRDPLLRPPIC